jgi:hypothetical protein
MGRNSAHNAYFALGTINELLSKNLQCQQVRQAEASLAHLHSGDRNVKSQSWYQMQYMHKLWQARSHGTMEEKHKDSYKRGSEVGVVPYTFQPTATFIPPTACSSCPSRE